MVVVQAAKMLICKVMNLGRARKTTPVHFCRAGCTRDRVDFAVSAVDAIT
jgi:hypothetical protein